MAREITKENACRLIEDGNGYYSPYTHSPIEGTTGCIVVFAADRFFICNSDEFSVKVEKVLRFDRGSMIVSHLIRCHNDEIGTLIQGEVDRMARMEIPLAEVVAISPPQKRQWYVKFIAEPHDRNSE